MVGVCVHNVHPRVSVTVENYSTGLAPSMKTLIAARAIAGMGGGGIMTGEGSVPAF